jgi:hypothetical protein
MKIRSLISRVRELQAAGKAVDAADLILAELKATRTQRSPTGETIAEPDCRRQMAALRIILGSPKKRG